MVHLPVFLAHENRNKAHKNLLNILNLANVLLIVCVAGSGREGKGSKLVLKNYGGCHLDSQGFVVKCTGAIIFSCVGLKHLLSCSQS